MGKALRDFTVEELDALPVGARFVDRDSWNDPVGLEQYAERWAYRKNADGRWARGNLTHLGMDAAVFQEDWRDDPYILEGDSSPSADPVPPELRAALAPFVRVAANVCADMPDHQPVFKFGDAWLTAGDLRRAAKALNPA